MKGLSILAAFLGGAVVGAAAGILFAPESGEDTRSKIADALRKRGIKLSRTDMENLVDEIAAEVKESATPTKVYCHSGYKSGMTIIFKSKLHACLQTIKI